MTKRKSDDYLTGDQTPTHTTKDFVFYQGYAKKKIHKISPMKIGRRPIYIVSIDYNGEYFSIQYMLDFGYPSFVLSPEAAKAFKIPVVKRQKKIKTRDVTRRDIVMEG